MTVTIANTQAEAQIRQLIDDHTQAICTKNLDQILSHYADNIVLFDMKPPLALNGIEACRQMWANCLPYMPTPSGMEQQDICIAVDGDLALAHWISRFTGIAPDHPAAQLWLRLTTACQRQQDGWHIIHEHVSIPVAAESRGDCAHA